ncbi:MAG: hypothetical protein V3S74_06100 [Alphaproteobacteria bacterium]
MPAPTPVSTGCAGAGRAAKALNHDLKTFFRWAEKHPQFKAQFDAAREAGYYRLAESLMDVADQERDPQKARLKADNIKWLLSKWNPKKYGDRIDINVVNNNVSISVALEEARKRLQPPVIEGEAEEVL